MQRVAEQDFSPRHHPPWHGLPDGLKVFYHAKNRGTAVSVLYADPRPPKLAATSR
jgi:hypothetical protein